MSLSTLQLKFFQTTGPSPDHYSCGMAQPVGEDEAAERGRTEQERMLLLRTTLRERREELGLKQEEVGARMGSEKSDISRWETGAAEPRISSLFRHLDALETTLGDLADRMGESGAEKKLTDVLASALRLARDQEQGGPSLPPESE